MALFEHGDVNVFYTDAMVGELVRHGSRGSNPDADLANMGYKSELPRSLSMMSILGLYDNSRNPVSPAKY